jgi:hypothetical protein
MPAWKKEPDYWRQSERRKLRDERQDEANCSRYLDQLGKREEGTWNRIAAHIQKRQPNEYDKAITLLIDLRDLALRQGRVDAFRCKFSGDWRA